MNIIRAVRTRTLQAAPDPVARRARAGVFGFFFLNGFIMGAFAAGLPGLDDRLGLGPARLGSVLLLVSCGALASMLVAGRLVDRWSSARICRVTGPVSAIVLLGPAVASSYHALALLAVVYGLGVGVMEVAMNVHSVEVEHRYGRPIVSAFHGVWSLGGAAAGALTAAALAAGVDGRFVLLALALGVPFGFLTAARALLPPGPVPASVPASVPVPAPDVPAAPAAPHAPQGSGRFRWSLVALLGAVAFSGHLSEGAAMDWAAVHARWVLDADPALAPLAYTVFSVAMTTVRLLGDPLRARLGPVRTIRCAGAFATTGYLLILAAPLTGDAVRLAVAWSGWALAGVGLATVVPVIFSAVGAAGGSMGRALSLVTAFGYTGLLLGPAVLGYVAEHASLSTALVIPTVLAATVALVGAPAIRGLTAHDGPREAPPSSGRGPEGPDPVRVPADP